jgi:hypothetical protein
MYMSMSHPSTHYVATTMVEIGDITDSLTVSVGEAPDLKGQGESGHQARGWPGPRRKCRDCREQSLPDAIEPGYLRLDEGLFFALNCVCLKILQKAMGLPHIQPWSPWLSQPVSFCLASRGWSMRSSGRASSACSSASHPMHIRQS